MKKWILALAAVLVLAGVAAGAYFAYDHHRDQLAAEKAEKAEAAAKAECTKLLTPLSKKLQEINARTNVGLNQSEMHGMVSDASVLYQGLDVTTWGESNPGCLDPASDLEAAFNSYTQADDQWSKCLQDYPNCKVEGDVLTKMRAKWLLANTQIDAGKKALDGYVYAPPLDKGSLGLD